MDHIFSSALKFHFSEFCITYKNGDSWTLWNSSILKLNFFSQFDNNKLHSLAKLDLNKIAYHVSERNSQERKKAKTFRTNINTI